MGNADFIEGIRNKYDALSKEQLMEVGRIERRSLAKPLRWYKMHMNNPKDGMAQAFATGGYTMKEIADYFGVHYSTVSRAVKAQEE